MTPARGKLFVRHIETPETLPEGKVILPERVRELLTACQVEIVAVGAGAICKDGDCERPHNRVEYWDHTCLPPRRNGGTAYHLFGAELGDWAVIQRRSLTETHLEGVYCCQQDDVLARLTE